MRAALAALGIGRLARQVVLVGGTNGKGTACAALNAIAMQAGLRTGLFTSPHLVDFRERARVSGRPIPVADVMRLLPGLLARFGSANAETGRALSFFELTTLLAFSFFAEQQPSLDVAVIEVGMGGRLDATNAIEPDISILTSLSLDHTQYLGTTLDAIAAEKAPIARAGRPLLLHRRSGGFAQLRAAVSPGVPIVEVSAGRDAAARNRALASEAARLVFPALGVPDDGATRAIREGRRAARWPARQQRVVVDGRTWLIDGAHNPASTRAAARWLRGLARDGVRPVQTIVALTPGRDVDATLRPLLPWLQDAIVVPASSERTMAPEDVAAWLRAAGATSVTTRGDAAEAVAAASEPCVLVVGSLYLCGAVLDALGFTAETLEVFSPSTPRRRTGR